MKHASKFKITKKILFTETLIIMTGLYRNSGLKIYEKSHYSHGEYIAEVEQILTWYRQRNTRILDIGCSSGLHALEFAKRGFYIEGLDIEQSAIELAKKRNSEYMQKAGFRVVDIEKDELCGSEKFDLIYSIGNVFSHVRKNRILNVFLKVKGCLGKNGIFLFDVLMNTKPFRKEINPKENELQIIWKRQIDEETGRIGMDGIFLDFDFTQHFEVWGYTIREITELLNHAGFGNIEFSEKLDFNVKNQTEKPISLYFRAKY